MGTRCLGLLVFWGALIFIPNHSNAECTTTIDCKNGNTATCSKIDHGYGDYNGCGTSKPCYVRGRCFKESMSTHVCQNEFISKAGKLLLETDKRFVCCNTDGDAITTPNIQDCQ